MFSSTSEVCFIYKKKTAEKVTRVYVVYETLESLMYFLYRHALGVLYADGKANLESRLKFSVVFTI
jgi:hypothetical protein